MPMTRNDARSSVQIRKLTYSALYLAIALVLPFLTGQIPEIGSMLCPMHIPALLCGFVCGWPWGLAVGFVSPLLRSLLFGMPTAYTAVAMAFELAAYGAVSGILYRIFPRRNWSVYVTLIAAMIVGRLVWGCVQFMMAGLQHTVFDRSLFLAGASDQCASRHPCTDHPDPHSCHHNGESQADAEWDEIMTEDRIGKEISGSMHRRFPSRKRGPIQYGWVLFSK